MRGINYFREEYYAAVYDTDRERALSLAEEALAEGHKPEEIVFKTIIPSLEKMAHDLEGFQGATLSQHYICSRVSAEITEKLLPLFTEATQNKGTVVLGTSKGDFHGLGKKIVGGCLSANMFQVIDLGINVNPQKFIEKALENKASIIGVSSMMLHTARGKQGSLEIRKLLEQGNLDKQIKIIVGGAPFRFDNELYRQVGADGWADTGLEAVDLVKELMGKEES